MIVTACSDVVGATSNLGPSYDVVGVYPEVETVSTAIPNRPQGFLKDAAGSLNAPSASIMAACSAIDAMLKEKGIGRLDDQGKQQSLAKRIDLAVAKNILTEGMSIWAHRIRLDANDQRHADEDVPPPTIEQARQVLRLSKAIAELLFILPAALPTEDEATEAATA